MSSKGTILVTGTNGGLGTAIVGRIFKTPSLADNYTGVYTVRKTATAKNLQNALQAAPGSHRHETVELDLSSLAHVRSAAADINSRVEKGEIPPIRALVLNAGYQDHTDLTFTKDGFETTWHVNYLANLLLTLLLLQSMDKENGRIVMLGSWSHDDKDPRNETGGNKPFADQKWHAFPGVEALAKGEWSTPQDDPSWLAGFRRYGASKLCAVMFMHELAIRLGKDPKLSNIAALSVDPGAMASDLARRGSFFIRFVTSKVLPPFATVSSWFSPNGTLRTTTKSAGDVLSACFDVETPPKGRLLYLNGSDEFETSEKVKDDELREQVWEYGVKVAKIGANDTLLENWQ